MELAYIRQFAHRAVRFGGVELDKAIVTDGLCYQRSQIANGDFLPGANVDMSVADLLSPVGIHIGEVAVLHEEYAGIGHLLAP